MTAIITYKSGETKEIADDMVDSLMRRETMEITLPNGDKVTHGIIYPIPGILSISYRYDRPATPAQP